MIIRVLLVDDDEDLLFLSQEILSSQESEFKLVSAKTGLDAIRILDEGSIDAVICDYNLGVGQMNGLEILQWMRDEGLTTPFIIFTGYSREEIAIQALNLGADFYIEKSDDFDTLFAEIGHHIRNVVRSRKTEEALAESEERLRKLSRAVEHSPAGIMITDTEGILDYVNPKFTEMTGYSSDEIIGLNPSILQSGLTPPETYIDLWEKLGEGKEWHGEFVNRKKNGMVYWEDARISPIADSNGNITHYMAIKQDITAQRQADDALKRSEERFRNIFESSPNGMFIYELMEDGRLVFFDSNPAADRILGLDCSDYIGKTIEEAFPPLIDSEVPKRYREAASVGIPWSSQQFVYSHDGIRGVYEIDAFQISKNKMVTAFVDITERITAQEELLASKERYRRVIEDQTEFITRWKPDGIRTFVNNSYCRYYGLTREEAIGTSFYHLISDEDLAMVKERIKSITYEKPVSTAVHRVILPDGSTGWNEWTDRGFFDEAGNLIEYQSTGRDITVRKLAEQKIVEERNRAQMYLDIAGVMLVALNSEGLVTLINQRGLEILGYNENEILGKNWFNMFVPEKDRKQTLLVFKQLMKGEIEPVEYFKNLVVSKSGEEHLIAWHNTILKDSKGRVIGTFSSGEDITEQQQAEDALRDSEERYRVLFEQSNDGIYLRSIESKFIDVNPGFLKMTGYTREELIGSSVHNLIPLADQSETQVVMKQVESLGSGIYEGNILKKNGELLRVEIVGSLIESEDQKFVQGIIRDISKRKAEEEAIRQNHEDLQSVFDTIDDLLFILDLDGNVIQANQTAANRLGYTMEEMVNLHALELHPSDRRDEAAEILQQMAAGKTTHCPVPLICKDGSIIPVDTRITLGRMSGNEILIGLTRDVSGRERMEKDLKESEERYRTLVENIPVVSWTTDADGNTIYISPNVEQIYGYSPEEIYERGSDLWFGRIHPEDVDRVMNSFKDAMETDAKYDIEYRIKRKDGEWIWLHDWSIGSYVRDEITLLSGVFEDITKRKEIEETLEGAEEHLRVIVENSPNYITLIDVDGIVLFMNRTLPGLAVKDLINKSIYELLSQERESNFRSQLEHIMETKESVEYETKFEDSIAGTVVLNNIVSPVFKDEEIVGFIVSAQNITNYKLAIKTVRAEKDRFETYFDTVGSMIVVLDQEGLVTRINKKGCELLGYEMDAIIGKNWMEHFIPDRLRDSIYRVHNLAMTGSVSEVESYENPILTKNGEERVIAWRNVTLTDENGNLSGAIATGIDITDRVIAKQELAKSEERYRALFENTNDAVFLIDLEGRHLDVNEKGAQLTGHSVEELIGRPLWENVAQEERDESREMMKRLLAGEEFPIYERNLITKEGAVVPVEINVTLARDSQGLPLHIQSVVRDVSQRKLIEKSNEQHVSFLENVLESLNHPFYVIDAEDYTIKLANSAARLGSLEHNPTCHKLTHNNSQPCNYDDHPCPLKQIKKTKLPVIVEHQHFDNSGILRDVQVHAHPIFNEDGEVIQMIEYTLDITETKNMLRALEESESRFREMYENLPLSYHSLNEEGNLLEVNDAWLQSMKYTREDVIGRFVGDFMTPESRELLGPRFCAFKQDGFIHNLEFEMVRKDNSILVARFNGRVAYDEHGNFKQTHCIFQDVTDLKVAEEIMKTKNTELSDLAHVMSHDLGNKMRTIHGLIKRYRQKSDEEVLDRIDGLAQQTSQLLKASARLADSGLVIEKKEKVNLDRLVRKIAETTIPETVKYSQSKLPIVQGSPEKIGQIFHNLFENAIEHGNPTLIKVYTEESVWGTSIFIINDGYQIPSDIQNDIFKRGFSTKHEGTGLGLAIVRKLVEAHGWKIDLHNGRERDTKFRIEI
ncbi:MAG: PAS domain S-box protein [Candidatus Thorarchaeota archaeon]